MLRLLRILLLPLLLASCAEPVYLYVDDLAGTANPEIAQAWSAFDPFHPTILVKFRRANAAELTSRLSQQNPGDKVLVAVGLGDQNLEKIVKTFPNLELGFLGAPSSTLPKWSISRGEAWAVVAARVAKENRPGWVKFPSDALPSEKDRFFDAWTQAGGHKMTEIQGETVWIVGKQSGELFYWDNVNTGQLSGLSKLFAHVSGDPGLLLPTGVTGWTWQLDAQRLKESLYNYAEETPKKFEFAPLETTFVSR